MKRELITATVAVHYIQARIFRAAQEGKVNLNEDSLRTIAQKIGVESYPQKIKHHIEVLVNLGALQKVNGLYVLEAEVKSK